MKGIGSSQWGSIACVILMLWSWSPPAQANARLVLQPDVRTVVEANRSTNAGLSEAQLVKYLDEQLYNYTDLAGGLQPERIVVKLPGEHTRPDLLGVEEAAEEIDLLFSLIKYGYAGYQYFGGDGAFSRAREEMLQDLLRYGQAVPVIEYLHLICRRLGFVQDGHFGVENLILCKDYQYWADNSYEFDLDQDGFYITDSLNSRRLISVDGVDPSAYMRPSIDRDGIIKYVPGVVSSEHLDGTTLSMEFSDGESQNASLSAAVASRPGGPAYELDEADGIPIVAIRSFTPTPRNKPLLDRMLADAERLWEQEAIVIDLRGNSGGNEQYVFSWLLFFILTCSTSQSVRVDLLTDVANRLTLNARLLQEEPGSSLGAYYTRMRELQRSTATPGWSEVRQTRAVRAASNPFIAVLIDRDTASAGESFVQCLLQMDNVVLIGVNTKGLCLTGTPGLVTLPYSGLTMSVPTALRFAGGFINVDGMGYFPDFWVHPDCALERTLKFMRRYLVEQTD